MPDVDLALYQEALLALLSRDDIDSTERARLLRSDARFAGLAAYLDEIEPWALDVGAELVRKWAVEVPVPRKPASKRKKAR